MLYAYNQDVFIEALIIFMIEYIINQKSKNHEKSHFNSSFSLRVNC